MSGRKLLAVEALSNGAVAATGVLDTEHWKGRPVLFVYGEVLSRDDAARLLRRKRGVPYAVDSATSAKAAASIRPHLGKLEADVLAAFHNRVFAGLTTDEAEVLTGLSHQTCSARINGLVAKGLLKRAGEKRRTRSGRPAEVYTVVGTTVPVREDAP